MHQAIHEWAQRFALDGLGTRALWQPSRLHEPPSGLTRHLRQGLAVLAGLLLGAGLLFWVAANWQDRTRTFKLGLLEAAVLFSVLAAVLVPRARTAALLLATLTLGGLLAFVGHTYQTGADVWQLFAAWAALALVWVLMARSDGVWALWLLIAGLGIAAWSGETMLGGFWSARGARSLLLPLLWVPLFALSLVLPWLGVAQRPRISFWVATSLALSAWVTAGIWGLLAEEQWRMFALTLALAAAVLTIGLLRRPRDWIVLSLAVLALDVLAIAGGARLLLHNSSDWFSGTLMLGVLAAVCVGASGTWLVRLQRPRAQP